MKRHIPVLLGLLFAFNVHAQMVHLEHGPVGGGHGGGGQGGGGVIIPPSPVVTIPQLPDLDAMHKQMAASAEGYARMNYGSSVAADCLAKMTTYDVTMRENLRLLGESQQPSTEDWGSLQNSTSAMRKYLQESIDIFDKVWGFFPLDKPNKSNRNSPFHLSGLKARDDLNKAVKQYDDLYNYAKKTHDDAHDRETREIKQFYASGESERFNRAMNDSLQAQAIECQREWKASTDLNPVVRNAKNKERQVQQAVIQANQLLPEVTGRMEQAATDYVRQQIESSQTLATDAVDYARCETDPSVVRTMGNYALDTVNSVNVFLGNVAGGFYDGFVTSAQAMQAIYNNPHLIRNLSGNVLLFLEGERGRQILGAQVARAAQEGMQHFRDALYSYSNTMVRGSLEERGHAIGTLGHQVAMLALGPEISTTLVEAGASGMLGEALRDGVRASEVLAPEMVAAEEKIALESTNQGLQPPLATSADARMLMQAREAVMRNLEVCRAVRNGYRAEVEAIKETANRMLVEGNSEEMVARHVHGIRREIGQRYKDMTPPEVLEHIYGRNLENGADPLGPTIEEMRAGRPAGNGKEAIAPKTWRDIINSASRSNKSVDRFFDMTIGD